MSNKNSILLVNIELEKLPFYKAAIELYKLKIHKPLDIYIIKDRFIFGIYTNDGNKDHTPFWNFVELYIDGA